MKYGTLELQTKEIITESVEYRHMANRILNSVPISRKSGNKFLSEDFGTKNISIEGTIISTSASGLLGNIDNMQRVLAIPEQQLQIDNGRVYVATCSKAEFPEFKYNQTATRFALEFTSETPFSYGTSQVAQFTIASGVKTYSVNTTISGTAYAEPQVTLSTQTGAGDSGITSISAYHLTSGNTVTVSGAWSKSTDTVLNYENATVTYSGVLTDYTGSFQRWEVGENTLTITLGGSNNFGVTGKLQYTPRYYF